MENYRATLGLGNFANGEDIKKAYRKLAMQHHPDRGGNEEAFKRIKNAYEQLEKTGFAAFVPPRAAPSPQRQPEDSGWDKPASPSGTWRDSNSINDIYDEMRAANRARQTPRQAYPQPGADIIMDVPIREAAKGFEWRLARQKSSGFIEHLDVIIPAGLPDGHRGRYTLSDGSTQVLIMQIDAGKYKLRGLSNTVGTIFEAGISTGDIEIDIDMDAIDLITGTWFEVQDFQGEKLTVRVPAGFNPDQRLKVAGKGYFGWVEEQTRPATYRKDMYIKLRPVFNSPDKIDKVKIRNLYKAVGESEETNESTQP